MGRGGGQSGTGGGGAGTSSGITGSWRNVFATATSVIDTRWSFTAGGACVNTVITTQLDPGRENTVVRPCTFTLNGSSLSVTFSGSSFVSTFSVAFSGGELLLDGFRFRRFA